IKSIPGIQYVELQNADQCCGSGGSYNIAHYDTAQKINVQKVKNIINTGADLVLTGCPACMMQLSDGLSQANSSIKVWHTIQLVDLAYRGRAGNG
ncbi:MAG: (Fe-S)-binding protein, partial [Opitutales bacterium]|nr:(Fe-S)-binding protein [Opitutales bacterium]